jgi:hypothetical protein
VAGGVGLVCLESPGEGGGVEGFGVFGVAWRLRWLGSFGVFPLF